MKTTKGRKTLEQTIAALCDDDQTHVQRLRHKAEIWYRKRKNARDTQNRSARKQRSIIADEEYGY